MTAPKDPAEANRLRLSREVRIGELIAALGLISAMATGYIEMRLRPLEQQIAAADAFKRELRDDIRRVNDKLDRLIEQRGTR
jgi:hypothetical protein